MGNKKRGHGIGQLPFNIVHLPTLVAHNPVSWLHFMYVWLWETPRQPTYHGTLDAETQSVHVVNALEMEELWLRGYFGKGSLSRSEPSWAIRNMRAQGILGPQEKLTSEEITMKRRLQRRNFKQIRAEQERKNHLEVLRREGKVESEPLVDETPEESRNDAKAVASTGLLSLHNTTSEHLQLSLEEAFFLSYALGVLEVRNGSTKLDSHEILRSFCNLTTSPPGFNLFLVRYVAYHHFRTSGWVVKSGVKFGVDFLLYKRGPSFSHAEFGIVLLPTLHASIGEGSPQLNWHQLHCINRVNAQVRKTVILVYVEIIETRKALEAKGSIREMLESFRIHEYAIQRWQPNRSRD